MKKGMRLPFRLHQGRWRGREYYTRSSEREGDDSRFHRADADRLGGPVSADTGFDSALRMLPQEVVLFFKIFHIGFHPWILGHTGSVILILRRPSVQPIFFTWLFSNCLYLSSNLPATATFSLIGRRTLCLSLTTKLSAACS
jgi:hypothetical protein